MSQAEVKNIEKLQEFQQQLKVFKDDCSAQLDQVERNIRQFDVWIKENRLPFWKSEQRSRHEEAIRAKNEYENAKMLSRDTYNDLFYEKKKFEKAVRRKEEAELKIKRCKYWSTEFTKASMEHIVHIRQLQREIRSHVPQGITELNHYIQSLEAYLKA